MISPVIRKAVLMVCPFCLLDINELWQPFYAMTDWQGNALLERKRGANAVAKTTKGRGKATHITVEPYWAVCPKCGELIVKICKSVSLANKGASKGYVAKLPREESAWFALPQRKTPPTLSNIVPEGMARDYREAHAILEDSPRMSSVLSRRILADLLEKYAKTKGYTLAKQIDKFISDKRHPARHRKNLHYLREIGDFSAHTKLDAQGNIIDVSAEEAEWTLRVVAELFNYFIVDPETDKAIQERMDARLAETGRRPIAKLTDEDIDENGKEENTEDNKGEGDTDPQAQRLPS